MRWVRWGSAIVWVGSWRIVYLEIYRWRHLTKTLRFDPPQVPEGLGVTPKAGTPVRLVRVAAIVAPLVFLATTIAAGGRRDVG